jgi:hypothetical protein
MGRDLVIEAYYNISFVIVKILLNYVSDSLCL